MIILVAGSTPAIRGALAEKICAENDEWRHLAMEDLSESLEAHGGKEYDEDQLLAIACNCANEMQKDGYHMILSLKNAKKFVPVLRENIEGDCLAIHLGEPHKDLVDIFDHVINTKNASINDIEKFLRPLLLDPPDA